ncbi:hypothetical protein [Micromonospora costi]|uniref:Uncharacterized protein n=1 Tax=Micromonospora costi TaxID=1530042 RepID=A0A3B0AA30_9ACTN|nr:hypothetical protein [Micromonospora costi]RKN56026.1 hypothetical protein D7193_15855 [Micromonospora costi]
MARRERTPRRIALDVLRSVKSDVGSLIARWDVTGKVYLHPHEREDPSRWFRPRQPHEYPENDPQAWTQLAADAEEVARTAMALRRFALDQKADLLRARRGGQQ